MCCERTPSTTGQPGASVEEVEANAHELTELRLLLALRTGSIDLHDVESEEIERVVERAGLPARSRLDLDLEASAADLGRAVTEAVGRWRRRAEHPLAAPDLVAACQVMQRTYEGMLVEA